MTFLNAITAIRWWPPIYSPVNFYNWQKQLFENAEGCFERKKNGANQRRQDDALLRKVEQLEEKVQNKNEVIAELLQEHVQLKKEIGES